MKLLRFACFQLALLGLVASQAAAYTNTAMQPVSRDGDWLKRHEEFLAQNFAGMERREFFRHGGSLVVVRDFNVGGAFRRPPEANPELIVDPDRM